MEMCRVDAFRREAALKLWIQVKPNSRKEEVTPLPDGSLQVRVQAPPADGRANEAVIRLLADHFKVPKSSILLRTGSTGRRKLIEITDETSFGQKNPF